MSVSESLLLEDDDVDEDDEDDVEEFWEFLDDDEDKFVVFCVFCGICAFGLISKFIGWYSGRKPIGNFLSSYIIWTHCSHSNLSIIWNMMKTHLPLLSTEK